MWTRAELKERGREIFQRNYWLTVGILVLACLIASGAAGFGSIIPGAGNVAVCLLVVNPLLVGQKRFLLNNRQDKGKIEDLFFAFKENFGNVILGMFLMGLFEFLWSLLFIVPGIIKSYEYRMIPYLLADDPNMDYKEAFARSKQMMDGQKMNAFLLDLSFIGWFLLCMLTCGILAIFWVDPYYQQTCAELYVVLKGDQDVVETVDFTENSGNGSFTDTMSQAAADFDNASDHVVDGVDNAVRDTANSAYDKVSGVMDNISEKASDVAENITDPFKKD